MGLAEIGLVVGMGKDTEGASLCTAIYSSAGWKGGLGRG